MQWVEIKRKTRATPTIIRGGQLETGFSRRLWREYLRVRNATGAKVFVMFVHHAEDIVTLDDSIHLEAFPPRESDSDRMGTMVF